MGVDSGTGGNRRVLEFPYYHGIRKPHLFLGRFVGLAAIGFNLFGLVY
jgi:hypothetical protein